MELARLPRRLRTDTILEAVGECRFRPKPAVSPSGLLPGHLFRDLRARYPKLELLPLGRVPEDLRVADPSIRYSPVTKLAGEAASILIGDRSVAVVVDRPYVGWEKFKSHIIEVWQLVAASGVIDEVERISVKYTNLLPAALGANHFALTKVAVGVGDRELSTQPTVLRTELAQGGLLAIVVVMTQASAKLANAAIVENGVVVEVDAILTGPFGDFWSELPSLLEQVHTFEKQVFFSIPSDAEIQRYGPEY